MPKEHILIERYAKTKMCPFLPNGKCKKGDKCKYAHSDAELRPMPDLTKTKMCPKLELQGGCHNPRCTFAHRPSELRATADLYKTALCPLWQTGNCTNARCRYAHGIHELRARPTPAESHKNNQREKCDSANDDAASITTICCSSASSQSGRSPSPSHDAVRFSAPRVPGVFPRSQKEEPDWRNFGQRLRVGDALCQSYDKSLSPSDCRTTTTASSSMRSFHIDNEGFPVGPPPGFETVLPSEDHWTPNDFLVSATKSAVLQPGITGPSAPTASCNNNGFNFALFHPTQMPAPDSEFLELAEGMRFLPSFLCRDENTDAPGEPVTIDLERSWLTNVED